MILFVCRSKDQIEWFFLEGLRSKKKITATNDYGYRD